MRPEAAIRDPRTDLSIPVTEAQLQQAVIETARTFGWRVAHFRPAQTKHGWRTPVAADGKGFPDLCMVNPRSGRLIFAELKASKGKLTAEQEAWMRDLAAALPAADVCLWTPEDWPNRIVAILSGRPTTERSAA